MPIKILDAQRRFAEQGRIRLGQKGDRGQPQKLDRFRFTSSSEQHIRDLAELYGGTPARWDNGGKAEWEVISDTTAVPVLVVKGGLTQWLEYWQGGGCIHRCDGEVNQLTNAPCDLDELVNTRVRGQDVPVNPHTAAKPTTRLSVMLPELESLGVWRLESHGWNAAAELPTVAELAQFVAQLVPARLHLQERRAIKDGKTSRFVVPVLDLEVSQGRLRELVEAQVNGRELQAPPAQERPALGSGSPAAEDPFAPYLGRVQATTVLDDLAAVWDDAKDAGLVGVGAAQTPQALAFVEAWKGRAHTLKRAEQDAGPAASPPSTEPDAEGVVDAELVPDADADAVWQQVLAAAGQQGMTEADLNDDFASRMGGLSAGQASAAELQHYLGLLAAGRAA